MIFKENKRSKDQRHFRSILLFLIVSLSTSLYAQKDTIYVSAFNVFPYSYNNAVSNIQKAIDECKRTGAKVLTFREGRYDLWPEGATYAEYFISNTSTEAECPSKVKTVGMLFKGINGLTIEGNGAMLMFHGKMTTMVFDQCENVRLQNISVDFERPTASEIRYVKADENGVEVSIHPDSRYQIVDGKIMIYGEGWKSNLIHCIEFDPEKETFVYSNGWKVLAGSRAEEVSRGIVRFKTPENFKPKIGNTLTIRDIIRDQVGMFLLESKGVILRNVNMYYMHGLGIVSQYVHNITMDHVICAPRPGSGRILAASADFMHFSGCSGKVSVLDCRFEGSHDDPINVHGTNLRVVEKINDRTLKLRFMHGQSYGFNAYFSGDEVAFVNAKTMERYAASKVTSVKKISEREVEVNFDRPVPAKLEINSDCVENMTCTPEVEIRNNYFTRTSTRGVLVTTPRKVVIEGNTFYKTGMSAILIEGDAEGWYESGPVNDVWIKNNVFTDCAYQGGPGNAVIALHPSNTIIDPKRPVHKNIRIEGNTFNVFDYPVLYAKSTSNLLFKDNTIIRTHTLQPSSGNKNTFFLNGCNEVVIKGTIFQGDVLGRNIKIENMLPKYVQYDKGLILEKNATSKPSSNN